MVLHEPTDDEKRLRGLWFVRQRLKVDVEPLIKVNQYPNRLAVLYLKAPEKKKPLNTTENESSEQNLEPTQNSTSTLRYLFHRLAIQLFTAEEVNQWQQQDLASEK